jgi:hypothetical protein
MSTLAKKSVATITIVPLLLVYIAVIAAHVLIEYTFSNSTLHTYEGILKYVPGINYIEDTEKSYCLYGKLRLVDTWSKTRCEADPLHRVTIHSEYMRKYWDLYQDPNNNVVSKRSWIVM